MDLTDLASRLEIDEDEAKEFIALFVTTTRSDIEKIRKGLLNQNPAEAAAASHSIKGAAGNLGLDDLFSLAGKMEMQAKGGSLDHFDIYLQDLETKVNALNPSVSG